MTARTRLFLSNKVLLLMIPTIVGQSERLASSAYSQSTDLYQHNDRPTAISRIDGPVQEKLVKLGIQPAAICSDSVFVRRLYLDVIGTLPTTPEVRSFLEDKGPEKRRLLVDQLLEREEFADYWSLKWCDLLRVKSEFPINLWPNAVQAYHCWVRSCIKANKPYDRFVREMLTSSGSNFRVPQVNFYRALRDNEPQTIARAVALTFMGARMDHWPQQQQSEMASFFRSVKYKKTGEWKEEIVFVDLLDTSRKRTDAQATSVLLPDGTRVDLVPGEDHRKTFADWLIRPGNPWFTRNIVNRIWAWLFGIGIINEPDDIRSDNPPTNPALLEILEQELVDSGYDLKHIYRLILNSATYQRSCVPTTDSQEAETCFAHYPIRRLDAEVLIDAICQVTSTHETYSSLIPEPWTFIPKEQRSISLADASITSPFLELFGRPARDTGLVSERNNTPSAAQKLHLLNSSHIRNKIESSIRNQADTSSQQSRSRSRRSRVSSSHVAAPSRPSYPNPSPATVTEIYLTVLSRCPTDHELAVVEDYMRNAEAQSSEAKIDLVWALINTPEFLYRH